MKNKAASISALLCVAAILGCASHPQGSVLASGMPAQLSQYGSPRQCSIAVANVADMRPKEETVSTEQGGFRYVVPLLLFNFSSYAGPRFMPDKYLDASTSANIGTLMNNVLSKSAVCSGEGKRYTLKAELLHFYGVSYQKNFVFAAAGGFVRVDFNFMPAGQFTMRLTLADENGDAVATRTLNDNFLFNPAHQALSAAHTARGGLLAHENNIINVASIALNKAMSRLPAMVDEMVAEDQQPSKTPAKAPKTFIVTRLTREYDFQEEIVIEHDSGKIISDNLSARTTPVISRPNEWVVAYYTEPGGRWMSRAEYDAMVSALKKKYNVAFTDNLTAATFRGAKK